MIKVENIQTFNFEGAIRGMRNPLNSWDKSDSKWEWIPDEIRWHADEPASRFVIGPNDLGLMRRLYKAGSEHRKYLRQIFVSLDITAPLYWWKEFDTYKVGTVSNSCSTMHRIAAKEFVEDDFSHEKLMNETSVPFFSPRGTLGRVINALNYCREQYLKTKDKDWWWQLIQLLPTSYNQKRTITMNYENVITIIKQRTNHKLDEWNTLIEQLKDLPYIKEIMEENDGD